MENNPLQISSPLTPTIKDGHSNAQQDQALFAHVSDLQIAIEHELRMAPAGLSEHALIKILQQPPWQLIGALRFDQPELLYPVHFLLFHALYTLQEQLAAGGETLSISPLLLRLHVQPTDIYQGLPERTDELRSFYLDLNQYRMSAQQIHAMLGSLKTDLRHGLLVATDADLVAAAQCLGFDRLPQNFIDVKRRFRRTVMRVHPDRGGTTEQIQSLNRAFGLLREHFRQQSQHQTQQQSRHG